MEYSKVKSTAKIIITKGPQLEKIVLDTMKKIADIVGATLGPGGCPVLIERSEDLPEMVTKDGVTVFKSLGMGNPVEHSIMSTARDAATRTGAEAGDGTTTATILAEAIVRYSSAFIKQNSSLSPQMVVRTIEKTFRNIIEPAIRKMAVRPKGLEESRKFFRDVAVISANGDTDIADAVMQAVELVGDKGNATILELSGPSKYEVERIEGFPIGKGYEESCARYFPQFINDQTNQRCYMEKPIFVLYDGTVSETGTIVHTMEMIGANWSDNPAAPHNVVLVAHGFSDRVLAELGTNFMHPQTINVFPLLTPQTMIQNSRTHFLYDLQAFTGAKVFNLLSKPISSAKLTDFGTGMDYFEAYRFRSTVVGNPDSMAIQLRAAELTGQKKNAESSLEATYLDERIGIVTGGIARIKIYGASRGELREKRDRCEDAVCSVRGASEHGVLPGGGRILLNLNALIKTTELDARTREILEAIMIPSFEEPVKKILHNSGQTDEEICVTLQKLYSDANVVYDALNLEFVEPFKAGILDSVPAVLEAIRNSLSIASLLGTLGGCVVYPRDVELERTEARSVSDFLKDVNTTTPSSEADDRP